MKTHESLRVQPQEVQNKHRRMEYLMEAEPQTNRMELKRLSENREYPLTLSDNCEK